MSLSVFIQEVALIGLVLHTSEYFICIARTVKSHLSQLYVSNVCLKKKEEASIPSLHS